MMTATLADHAPRSQRAYFDTCNLVWSALCFYRMRSPSLWRTLRILHAMAPDYAITPEQSAYILRQVRAELGV